MSFMDKKCAVILAAGEGTRMKSKKPKALAEVLFAPMIDWVIGVPSQAERKVLVESFEKAIQAAACIIEHGCQKAMNDYN